MTVVVLEECLVMPFWEKVQPNGKEGEGGPCHLMIALFLHVQLNQSRFKVI